MKLKEIKLRPTTDKHDIEHKAKKATEFLEAGDRVRLTVKFRGREVVHKDVGNRILERLLNLMPESTYVGPIRDEPKSISVDLLIKKH